MAREQPPDLGELDATLHRLWDLRTEIDLANGKLIDDLAARQRDFLRLMTEQGPPPPSREVMREVVRARG